MTNLLALKKIAGDIDYWIIDNLILLWLCRRSQILPILTRTIILSKTMTIISDRLVNRRRSHLERYRSLSIIQTIIAMNIIWIFVTGKANLLLTGTYSDKIVWSILFLKTLKRIGSI